MIPSPLFFKDFVLILATTISSDQLSIAASNTFCCSCRKSPKQKSVLSEGFVNYLQTDLHRYRKPMNLKMREYNYSFVPRTLWPEDVSILASTHKPEDTRMWGCEDKNKHIWTEDMRMWVCKYTSKHTWTWEYEDVRTQGYKQAHMNLRIWGCEDARIQASTHEPENMRMQGYKQAHTNLRIWGCKDARIDANTYEPEDMRIWGCRDASKSIWTWRHEDERMRRYKQIYTNIRIWGCKDARIQATAQDRKDMRMWGCEDINKSNISNMQATSRLHTGLYT